MATLPSYSWSAAPGTRLEYIRNIDQANREVAALRTTAPALGFDLEWRPNFVKGAPENPVALVQIASRHTILLIQVSAMQHFPEELKRLLEAPEIVKAGAGIQNDVKKLYNNYLVDTRNCVDLSLLARSVDNARWKGKYSAPIGLARLIEIYEESCLQKGKVTLSNWEAVLNDTQQQYAANDAYAGYEVYTKLISLAKAMTIIPDPSCYTFDAVRGQLRDPSGRYWFPTNSNYDPGPPPPPKIVKPPKAHDTQASFATGPSHNTMIYYDVLGQRHTHTSTRAPDMLLGRLSRPHNSVYNSGMGIRTFPASAGDSGSATMLPGTSRPKKRRRHAHSDSARYDNSGKPET